MAFPAPLQHKQGFNLRGMSGLNNILSVTNLALKRHDLLSLDDTHYSKVFGDPAGHQRIFHDLDTYVETIELSADVAEKTLDAIAAEAHKIMRNDVATEVVAGEAGEHILAGPGFVLREITRSAPKQNNQPSAPDVHELRGEITASGLSEIFPVFVSDEVSALMPLGGSLQCTLRKGIAVLTNQARILANMHGTLMRFSQPNVFSFGDLSFAPRAYDANKRSGVFFHRMLRTESAPEPYIPKDIRFQFLLQWESHCPPQTMNDFLRLLIERQIVVVDNV